MVSLVLRTALVHFEPDHTTHHTKITTSTIFGDVMVLLGPRETSIFCLVLILNVPHVVLRS